MLVLSNSEYRFANYVIRSVDFATPRLTGEEHENGGYFIKWSGATVAVVFHDLDRILFAPFEHELCGTKRLGEILELVAVQQYWKVYTHEYDFQFKEAVKDCQDVLTGV